MDFVRVAGWERLDWLRHGFSRRSGGVSTVYGGETLNLGWTAEDEPERVVENRRRLARAVAGEAGREIVAVRQVHGTAIQLIRSGSGSFAKADGRAMLEGDGLMTDVPGVLLGIQTADCVPVLVIDPVKRAVAAFHAGWRGTAAGIVEVGVKRMEEEFGSRAEDLAAAVGPSIGACCYSVGEELRAAFRERFSYAEELFEKKNGRLTVDLWEANRRQLVGMGVGAVTVVGECSGCAVSAEGERRYFSHRVERGLTGRMMSLIGVFADPLPPM